MYDIPEWQVISWFRTIAFRRSAGFSIADSTGKSPSPKFLSSFEMRDICICCQRLHLFRTFERLLYVSQAPPHNTVPTVFLPLDETTKGELGFRTEDRPGRRLQLQLAKENLPIRP